MQTFSTMRRNSTHQSSLRIFFFSLFCVFYFSCADIYVFLPPLFGALYVIAQEKYEAESYEVFYFFVPLLLYFEANKGLPLSSTLLFLAFSFKIILPQFRKFFGYSKTFIPLFVFYAYFGYFVFLAIFALLFDVRGFEFSWLLFFLEKYFS